MEAVRSTAEKLAKLSESGGTPFTAEEYLKSVAESSEKTFDAKRATKRPNKLRQEAHRIDATNQKANWKGGRHCCE
jgi:hypothetical protein